MSNNKDAKVGDSVLESGSWSTKRIYVIVRETKTLFLLAEFGEKDEVLRLRKGSLSEIGANSWSRSFYTLLSEEERKQEINNMVCMNYLTYISEFKIKGLKTSSELLIHLRATSSELKKLTGED